MTRGVGGHSPANIQKHLRGVDYPADRDQLLQVARRNDAPAEVLEEIRNMPEQEYGGPQDVMNAYRKSIK